MPFMITRFITQVLATVAKWLLWSISYIYRHDYLFARAERQEPVEHEDQDQGGKLYKSLPHTLPIQFRDRIENIFTAFCRS